MTEGAKRALNGFAKRAFDVSASAVGLVLLSPLLLVASLLIKLEDNGPVFFVQKRVGRGFKPFDLYKFRTMRPGAHLAGLAITIGDDPRITRVGRFLRKTKLDELPQLLNVLKGDMSVVGPRPEVEKYVEAYRKDYERILQVRPGITDLASITYSDENEMLRGKEDPEAYYLNIILPDKIRLARDYVKEGTFIDDLSLMARTALKLLYPARLATRLANAPGRARKSAIVAIELAVFSASNYLAFYARFDGNIPSLEWEMFLEFLPLFLAIRVFFIFAFSLDRALWRYASGKDVARIAMAVTAGTIVFFVLVRYVFGNLAYPRSVYAMDWLINIFLLSLARFSRRGVEKTVRRGPAKRRVLIVGAGSSAEMFIRDVEQSPFYPYRIIGLIDDDPDKKGLSIRDVPILGARKDLKRIVEAEEPDEFLVAISSATSVDLENIVQDLRRFGLPIKILPSLWGFLSGRDALSVAKAAVAEDILFRPPLISDSDGLKGFFKGRRVMVTGAGGSIGSELSRHIASLGPSSLVLYERHEENLYKIDMALGRLHPDKGSFISPVVGDVLDTARLREAFSRHEPEMVFHAAAYKHVPLMEFNPSEAFKTNVLGTRAVARVSAEFKADRFVLVSTDKAVNPVNVMGKTKMLAERVVSSLAKDPSIETRFMTVRFGNVLESSGSVVPLFTEQIKRGGPLTVTHPEVTRFFMTIPEAVGLVLEAAAMGHGGEVFILDMGEPVKILDLAKRMLSLYGYRAGVDMDIEFTGLRPGEKLHEELFNPSERPVNTKHPKISRAEAGGKADDAGIGALLEQLALGDAGVSDEAARELLSRIGR